MPYDLDAGDTDTDGLSDCLELELWGTNFLEVDTDSDGIIDRLDLRPTEPITEGLLQFDASIVKFREVTENCDTSGTFGSTPYFDPFVSIGYISLGGGVGSSGLQKDFVRTGFTEPNHPHDAQTYEATDLVASILGSQDRAKYGTADQFGLPGIRVYLGMADHDDGANANDVVDTGATAGVVVPAYLGGAGEPIETPIAGTDGECAARFIVQVQSDMPCPAAVVTSLPVPADPGFVTLATAQSEISSLCSGANTGALLTYYNGLGPRTVTLMGDDAGAHESSRVNGMAPSCAAILSPDPRDQVVINGQPPQGFISGVIGNFGDSSFALDSSAGQKTYRIISRGIGPDGTYYERAAIFRHSETLANEAIAFNPIPDWYVEETNPLLEIRVPICRPISWSLTSFQVVLERDDGAAGWATVATSGLIQAPATKPGGEPHFAVALSPSYTGSQRVFTTWGVGEAFCDVMC